VNRINQTGSQLYLIPLVVGLLFAGLMVFFGVISTEKARNHYRANKLVEALQKFGPPRINASGTNRTFDPPKIPSVKKRSWYVKYEVRILLMAVPLAIFGLSFVPMAIGVRPPPARNPLNLDDSMRRSVLFMICSFLLSPACFLLYIWALRVGLIG
jgi:hypothetical protein